MFLLKLTFFFLRYFWLSLADASASVFASASFGASTGFVSCGAGCVACLESDLHWGAFLVFVFAAFVLAGAGAGFFAATGAAAGLAGAFLAAVAPLAGAAGFEVWLAGAFASLAADGTLSFFLAASSCSANLFCSSTHHFCSLYLNWIHFKS